jgi:hypothetical protein
MKHALLPLLILLTTWISGCASDSGGRGAGDDRGRHRRQAAREPTFESSAAAGEMGVQNEIGVYDSVDIEQTMAEHMEEIRGCYGQAGRAQKYVAGKVMLRFIVAGDGQTRDVLVIATDLGNYNVERCLVGVGRRIKFPPPHGNKATTFEYPVEFRSRREMGVRNLMDTTKVDRAVAAFRHSLTSCGAVAPTGVSAIFYVDPSGAVASVGLASESAVDEQAGRCVVREMRRWRMSASLPGRMLRCRANIRTVVASADPAPARSPTLGAASRRRRR